MRIRLVRIGKPQEAQADVGFLSGLETRKRRRRCMPRVWQEAATAGKSVVSVAAKMDRKISDCAHEFLLPKPTIGSAAPVQPTARSRSSECRANERTTPLLDGPSAPKHAALLRCHRITGQVLKPHDSGPSAFPPPFVGVRDTRHQLRPCFCHAPSAPALQRYVHYASDARSAAPAAPANRGGPPLTADALSSPPTFASKGGGPTAVRRHALTALFFASSAWPENRTVAAASCELRVAACNRVLLSSAAPGQQADSPTVQHCNTRASHTDHGVCCVFARSLSPFVALRCLSRVCIQSALPPSEPAASLATRLSQVQSAAFLPCALPMPP